MSKIIECSLNDIHVYIDVVIFCESEYNIKCINYRHHSMISPPPQKKKPNKTKKQQKTKPQKNNTICKLFTNILIKLMLIDLKCSSMISALGP